MLSSAAVLSSCLAICRRPLPSEHSMKTSNSTAYGPQPKIARAQLGKWELARPNFCESPVTLREPGAAPGAAPGAPGRPLRRAPAPRMCPCLPACGGASGSRDGNPPRRPPTRARVPAGGSRADERYVDVQGADTEQPIAAPAWPSYGTRPPLRYLCVLRTVHAAGSGFRRRHRALCAGRGILGRFFGLREAARPRTWRYAIAHCIRDKVHITNSWQSSRTCPQ